MTEAEVARNNQIKVERSGLLSQYYSLCCSSLLRRNNIRLNKILRLKRFVLQDFPIAETGCAKKTNTGEFQKQSLKRQKFWMPCKIFATFEMHHYSEPWKRCNIFINTLTNIGAIQVHQYLQGKIRILKFEV